MILEMIMLKVLTMLLLKMLLRVTILLLTEQGLEMYAPVLLIEYWQEALLVTVYCTGKITVAVSFEVRRVVFQAVVPKELVVD